MDILLSSSTRGRRRAVAVEALRSGRHRSISRQIRLVSPFLHPRTLRDVEAHKVFSSLAADVAVVAAYGLLLPNPILEAPRLGCINLHASLLPRWRGAAPIQRAIMAGDSQTGLDVMRMDAGLDTGPIAMREIIPILPEDTAGDLTARLSHNRGSASGERPKIVGGWSTRISGATGCGSLLCAQDREKRGGDRLDTGRGESSQSGSRAVACARRLFETLHWRSRGKYQVLACRNDRRERTAWNTPFRRHENRVRDRRDTGSSGATIRKDCHERLRIDAGREARARHSLQAVPRTFIRSRSMNLSSSLLPSAARKIWLARKKSRTANCSTLGRTRTSGARSLIF